MTKKKAAGPNGAVPQIDDLGAALERIASALERIGPPAQPALDLGAAEAFVWQAERETLEPVAAVNRVDLVLLQGIARQRETLLENTLRFARGLPANNALLWGARGMGKSSLVKAVHAEVNARAAREGFAGLILVEIHREDIPSLPRLLQRLRGEERAAVLFCDDLSFDNADTSYKSLKAVLEGGIEGRPANVIFYATSNRRHLMPRDMIENERSTAIHTSEAVEEKVSLSDRFGLWLGFHNCDQDTYFAMVEGYATRYGLDLPDEELHAEAKEWAITRGSRSGRVAWQYIQDLAGRLGKRLD
ncbi:MAG: ATP-binding protein [Kiloniellales bacterium]|nr:ATP-binding protein [Kiloniellales bacterium]